MLKSSKLQSKDIELVGGKWRLGACSYRRTITNNMLRFSPCQVTNEDQEPSHPSVNTPLQHTNGSLPDNALF